MHSCHLSFCHVCTRRRARARSYASIKTAGAELYYSVNRALASGQLDSVKDVSRVSGCIDAVPNEHV